MNHGLGAPLVLKIGGSLAQGDHLRAWLKLAADHLNRVQTPGGNVELLVTNFNSPPDTAFVMLNVAPAAWLARKHGETELFGMMEPFIRKAGHALATGEA